MAPGRLPTCRWDESGNPACLSKNGKECWKGEGSCAQKLRQVKLSAFCACYR
jgi:hypothetical protein